MLRTVVICLFSVLVVGGGTHALANDATERRFVVGDEVRQKLELAIQRNPPVIRRQISSMRLDAILRDRPTQIQLRFRYLPDGLVYVSSDYAVGKLSVRTVSLTLSALLNVISFGESQSNSSAVFGSAAGGSYVPFSVSTYSTGEGLTRMIALDGDFPNILTALPDSAFEFSERNSVEANRRTGVFSASSALENSYRWNCRVGADQPATILLPALTGTHRHVSCVRRDAKGSETTHDFAHLVDSGVYVRVKLADAKSVATYRIASVEYAE